MRPPEQHTTHELLAVLFEPSLIATFSPEPSDDVQSVWSINLGEYFSKTNLVEEEARIRRQRRRSSIPATHSQRACLSDTLERPAACPKRGICNVASGKEVTVIRSRTNVLHSKVEASAFLSVSNSSLAPDWCSMMTRTFDFRL